MRMIRWEDLPENMRTDEVKRYYDILKRKNGALLLKRMFDVAGSLLLLIILSPVFLILAIAIKMDSKGPVFYRQVRVTQYGKEFRIHKFRSMVTGADKKGTLVTVDGDSRITRVGRVVRGCRLDEICQLIDVLEGTMTFVGTRPEVPQYVNAYTPEMMATLLLPAGVTSLASVYYKDEAELLKNAENADEVYIHQILPEKMKWNLQEIADFSILQDIKVVFITAFSLLGIKPKHWHN